LKSILKQELIILIVLRILQLLKHLQLLLIIINFISLLYILDFVNIILVFRVLVVRGVVTTFLIDGLLFQEEVPVIVGELAMAELLFLDLAQQMRSDLYIEIWV
jgi:hypothetical protein